MGAIDWLAVGVSTLMAFVLGGLWYSPLMFHGAWRPAAKLTQEETEQNVGAVFAQAIPSAFVTALAFGFFASGVPLKEGLIYGVATGLGLVAASFSLNYAFERRPFSLLLINGAYYVVLFTLYGLIFALL